jgi:hypothetical protein
VLGLDIESVQFVRSHEQPLRNIKSAEVKGSQLIQAVLWKETGNNGIRRADFIKMNPGMDRAIIKE